VSGAALSAEMLGALSQADLASRLGRALPLVTVDALGRPHPMLCSYLEVLAVDAGTLRLVMAAASGSARNLAERGAATLLVIEPERTVYVKCRATGAPVAAGALARFTLRVEDVREDRAAGWEAGARITGGITYAPVPSLEAPEARATLALLRGEGA
jgi:flavin reductase (DIM6/NTAB) family NADH-FMN oxidoreductase RutF